MDVDLLLDPGGEVAHVAVDSRSQDFAEADAAPRRQTKQCPVTAAVLVLAHQRAAAVALETHTPAVIQLRAGLLHQTS